ncbi:MAG: ABC transporter permease [Acidimicrobiia bacterium]|nr:ABC transporter permease [Acidimicrobiia bacterium]
MDTTVLNANPLVVLAASTVLIVIAIAIARWLHLDIERSIVIAAVRASVQLIAVGVLLTVVIDSGLEALLAPLWIAVMVVIAAVVVARRAGSQAVLVPAIFAIGIPTVIVLAVVFGFGVLPAEPIQFIVVAGITIGNTLPATVLGTDQIRRQLTEDRATVEALLALGIDARRSSRFMVSEATRVAILPQIERTKVVGLVALPGAFTGLLIAGVAPLEAAVVQLVVMFLVLGSVAMSSAVVAVITAQRAFTSDQRLKPIEA